MSQKETKFRDIEVHYTDRGSGPCVVLLHGYLESSLIWESSTGFFTGQFRVIAIDLPGHGRSGTWGKEHCMDDLASAVASVLDAEGISRVFLVGHSMGGYVAMAFAELYPERLLAYCLIHSTCFADNEEKKENRDREVSLVLCGKKRKNIDVNIPKAFVIALRNGMKSRPDRSKTLAQKGIPVMLIGGMNDNYIPVEVFEKLASKAPHAALLRLEESGHMGFLEEAETSAEALIRFFRSHLS